MRRTDYYSIEENMKGKVAFMTGGTKGIARATAKMFVCAGANVVFISRTEGLGKEVEDELNAYGKGKAVFKKCDVKDHDGLKRCIDETVEQFGRLDTLINVAGVFPLQQPIDMVSIDAYKDVLETNLVAYYVTMKFALPYLRKTKGSIINTGSVLGTTGDEGSPAYTSTKGAINTLTRTMAIDEARNGVRVNEIKPGHINTEMFMEAAQAQADPEGFIKYSDSLQWLGRGGDPEEIGRAILFLASDWASFITGVSLHVSGGYEFGEGPKVPNPYLAWGEQVVK